MELLFGTNVREYGQRAGRLAGFEYDSATRLIREIIFSDNGKLGHHALARPFSSVLAEPGEVDIRPYTPSDQPAPSSLLLLSPATRVRRGNRDIGRLVGVEVEVGAGAMAGIVVRRNWWSRRFIVPAAGLDLSVSGEIRVPATQTQAA